MEFRVSGIDDAIAHLRDAAGAKKCWACGCLHTSLTTIETGLPTNARPAAFADALNAARECLTPVRYECLGCDVCYPALAVNALTSAGLRMEQHLCATDAIQEQSGWPPLAGTYTALRFHAPVAICTLTDDALATALARTATPQIAIAGTMQTENLGIERLVQNVLANPNLRSLIVAGADSRQAIGHLPGQSLVALARSGIDASARIIGAMGKRPVLRNVARDAIDHFRRTVAVVDLIGCAEIETILKAARECPERGPRSSAPYTAKRTAVRTVPGSLPAQMHPDPAGYFVIYVDRERSHLSLEHFRNDGILDLVIEGPTAAELYTTAIDHGMVSRLDHAAYLGRELGRAEHALRTGDPFVQDSAPERPRRAAPEGGRCGAA